MDERYEPQKFEAKWQERWDEADIFITREEADRPKFYGLDFFPYPSGAGLSVGHCRNYIPTDVICRMKFMQGYNVLHPMGWDAFGLPAENEAIAKKVNPAQMIERYAANYKRQMRMIGISYDWSREISSCDPFFYKWTQWIFKLLYKRGLAYRKMAAVNWDPVDKTVLADEEVIGGLGWRSGVPVEKRYIPQWFFRITAYADRLLEDLDYVDWPEGIKQQQRNWIGRSSGVEFEMKVDIPKRKHEGPDEFGFEVFEHHHPVAFRVFTTRVDTIFGMTFCVLAPEHPVVEKLIDRAELDEQDALRAYVASANRMTTTDRSSAAREKTGIFTGSFAINPVNGEKVPIYIADYVLMDYGTGAIMAVPGHDERDFEFAMKYGLPVKQVIAPVDGSSVTLPWTEADGVLVNSGEYDGMAVKDAQESLAQWMIALGVGEKRVTYKLRDWLISRQRYWGCPIPVMYTQDDEEQLVIDSLLPVLLPDVDNYEPTGDGKSPLANIQEFVNCTDNDGRLGRRETDTMGGFACSSWYFLRFCDPHNEEEPFNWNKVNFWMPVDCYVGGAEHAVMHLLYARFWTKVLYDEGLVPYMEPFFRLMNQGQVLAQTPYRPPREGEVLPVGETGIQISNEEAKQASAGEVFYKWARMSKSKGNVVTPDEIVEHYGADALRVYELFVAPFDQDVQWSNEGLNGATRFLNRVFKLSSEIKKHYVQDWKHEIDKLDMDEWTRDLRRATHQTIKKVTEDIDRFSFNTYIAALMTYLNTLNDAMRDMPSSPPTIQRLALSEAFDALIITLSPAAPHTADEVWEQMGNFGFIYHEAWPHFDPLLAKEDMVEIAVQVNGKLRDTLSAPADIAEEFLKQAALNSERVQAHINGRPILRTVVVPKRLVNFVIEE
ncbi:MAG: leucine--tRNA ligase [Fimbriimonadaceae bacterium]